LPDAKAGARPLPLQLGALDHYTLIVEDAAATARFHTEVMGFEALNIMLVNAGSVPEGQHDMLNHVLQIPGTSKRVMVVTEGLTEDSIFRRYLRTYGPGVHHVAYEVDDLDAALASLRAAQVKTTSAEVLKDPLTGLRQIFVDRAHSGYFIELIERTETARGGAFTQNNMAALANTMLTYLRAPEATAPVTPVAPSVKLEVARAKVVEFLLDPFNLPAWTGHRTIRRIGDKVVEVRMAGDLELSVTDDVSTNRVVFRWQRDAAALEVAFHIESEGESCTRVSVNLPPLDTARATRTAQVIQAELDVLATVLEGREQDVTDDTRRLIDAYHLEVHQRKGL
jgi:catechol 2,3-dioxygenase-like lactoylglutathione lyase family enzyme